MDRQVAIKQAVNQIDNFEQGAQRAGGVKVMGAAAAAGGVVGAVTMGGVIAPVALAAGAAYATSKDDKIGDFARAAGHSTIGAYKKASEYNEKHQVTDKVKRAAVGAYQKAVEIDDKYKVVDKTKAAASGTIAAANKFNEKHQITSKLSKAFVSGLSTIADKLDPPSKDEEKDQKS
ncbi:hypothetical protein GUITHDRAFT_150993 [Guillardia theta CCMP2712]|uniref:Uncharacterized protein n=1 Tax=Guillardia theta (strain CCMP2712) TaxID=905079 RepID=L1JRN8_GUITC|nr:hypothetical protein GUITHDRAFT_150993 [Guillardia theta CCMP2712]EKX51117.1 hypothetical protein GUITHDRAFT_150993 [Guillardia theta CCMP2712]|eukprot:XP_005838097.1 hypothetical protein GUITHDRAFT_150993 [Guillardia theta CCMP2712]